MSGTTTNSLYRSVGTLHYTIDHTLDPHPHKLIVKVDQELSDYYRALIPKYYKVRRQLYPAHVSTVRKENVPNLAAWGKHEGRALSFEYDGYIHNDERYWWLNTFSIELEQIRTELGLPISSKYTLPPSGFTKCFHMTIGNTK